MSSDFVTCVHIPSARILDSIIDREAIVRRRQSSAREGRRNPNNTRICTRLDVAHDIGRNTTSELDPL